MCFQLTAGWAHSLNAGTVIEPKRAKPPVDEDKLEAAMQREKEKIAAAKEEKEKKEQTWFDLKQNTSVYVTGLPEDVTIDEVRSSRVLASPSELLASPSELLARRFNRVRSGSGG